MQITITFDAKSRNWEKQHEFNVLFARTQHLYLTELYRYRGYIYLNCIYEAFGIEWNPYEKNLCWIYERDGELDMSFFINNDKQDEIGIMIIHNQSEKES